MNHKIYAPSLKERWYREGRDWTTTCWQRRGVQSRMNTPLTCTASAINVRDSSTQQTDTECNRCTSSKESFLIPANTCTYNHARANAGTDKERTVQEDADANCQRRPLQRQKKPQVVLRANITIYTDYN